MKARTPAAVVVRDRGAPGSRPAKPVSTAVAVRGAVPSSSGRVAVPATEASAGSGTPSPVSSTTEGLRFASSTRPVPASTAVLSGAGSTGTGSAMPLVIRATALITA